MVYNIFGENMETIEKEKLVIKTIEKIRPYIQADGGDVQFVRLEDGIVYVSVLGACIGCSALEQTLQDGVAALLMDEVPGIKGVMLDNVALDNLKQEQNNTI